MTDVKKILEGEIARIAGLLPSLDPTTDAYMRAVTNLGEVLWRKSSVEPAPTSEPTPILTVPCNATVFASEPELVKPPENPDVAAEPANSTDWGEYRASLRERLADSRTNKGVDITALLSAMGVGKLSSVPDERLPELSDLLDAALKEIG